MPDKTNKRPISPRRAALNLIKAVVEDGQMLSEIDPSTFLTGPDAALAQRLTIDTLRWAQRADRMLGPYLRQKPHPAVHAILRLGVIELAVHESAAHGVVHDLVGLAKSDRDTARASGLVNAVLRKVSQDLGKWNDLPVPALPKWLSRPLRDAYGKPALQSIETAHTVAAPIDVTLKDPAATERWVSALDGRVLETGSIRLAARAGQVTKLPGFAEGEWWVQDAAASIPATLLNAQPGERVLDICAAPGGKAMQLAATGAQVTALDISSKRLARLTENLERTGLEASLVRADALTWENAPFDGVLLDPPCSATGTIRRHPDLVFAKDGTSIEPLVALQREMFDRAVALVRPGGRIVFCTCSLLPAEGENHVEDFLQRHPGLSVDQEAIAIAPVPDDWKSDIGIRTRPDYWPELGGLDGFFIAPFRLAG